MTTALVTGVAGQDGTYLCEGLLAAGKEVHGVLRAQDRSRPDFIPTAVTLHEGDVTDGRFMADVLSEVLPDEIYHLAGISSVAASWAEPTMTTKVNALASVDLLHRAWLLQERTGRRVKVLQATSGEIFGPADHALDESSPLRPTNPYGVTKAFAHQMTGVYRSRGLFAVSAILFNHESPRRPPRFVSRKITQAVAAIAAGRGAALHLGNLDARRDWGWAPDHVRGMQLMVDRPEPRDFVLATGQEHSVEEFVAAAFDAVGIADWKRWLAVDPELIRPNDSAAMIGDSRRARSELGWSPSHSFDDVVQKMVVSDLADLHRDGSGSGS